jgi:hypothetical protein
MLLTIRDVSEDLVRQAKIATGKGTGSQAFIAGIELMIQQRDKIDDLQAKVIQLQEQLKAATRVMASARSAALQLVELTQPTEVHQEQPKKKLPGGY